MLSQYYLLLAQVSFTHLQQYHEPSQYHQPHHQPHHHHQPGGAADGHNVLHKDISSEKE